MKSCNKCKFAVFQDYGYSNYTVEGTNFECRKNAHPEGYFDRFYGVDERLNYAEKCEGYVEDESIEMDCDRENYDDLSQEQKDIYDGKV